MQNTILYIKFRKNNNKQCAKTECPMRNTDMVRKIIRSEL